MATRRNLFAKLSRLSYPNLALVLLRASKDMGIELDVDNFLKLLEKYALSPHAGLSEDERNYFQDKKLQSVKKPRKPKEAKKTLRVIKKGLVPEILKLRREGATWDEISRYLSKYHRVKVSRETLRQLCLKLCVTEPETNEHANNDG